VVDEQSVLQFGSIVVVFIATTDHIQVLIAVTIGIEEYGILVVERGLCGKSHRDERTSGDLPEQLRVRALVRGHENVSETIAVNVTGNDFRSRRRNAVRNHAVAFESRQGSGRFPESDTQGAGSLHEHRYW